MNYSMTYKTTKNKKIKLIKKAIKLTRKDYNKLLAKRNKLDNSINDLKL